MAFLIAAFQVSERRACRLLGLDRRTYRYRPQGQCRTQPLQERLCELARQRPRYGYRRLAILLRREGHPVNHKCVYRLYRAAGLAVRRVRRKRLCRPQAATPTVRQPNDLCALDFVSDGLASGQSIRVLTVIDHFYT